MTTHHEAQEKAKLNTMEVEDVVVDISQRQFVASVQQRLLVFIMGEALAEAAPGVSNNLKPKDSGGLHQPVNSQTERLRNQEGK